MSRFYLELYISSSYTYCCQLNNAMQLICVYIKNVINVVFIKANYMSQVNAVK